MGETLNQSYILMDWVNVNRGWWQQIFSIDVTGNLMELRQYVPLGDLKDM